MSRNVPRCVGGVRPGGTSGAIRSVSIQLAFFLVSIGAVPFSAGCHRFFSPGGAHPLASAHRLARRKERGWRHDVNEQADSTSANPVLMRIGAGECVERLMFHGRVQEANAAADQWRWNARFSSFGISDWIEGWFEKQKLRERPRRRRFPCAGRWTGPGSRACHRGFRFLTIC